MQLIDTAQKNVLEEIRDANLNYLMLAKQMIKTDKAQAIFRLSLSADIADLLGNLSNAQIIKLASANMMLTRFRFDDSVMLSMLTSNEKGQSQSITHSSILMSCQPVESIS